MKYLLPPVFNDGKRGGVLVTLDYFFSLLGYKFCKALTNIVDCPPSSKACEIANVLQFLNDEKGQTWFTELSENNQ